eukprot:c9831_g1_i2.p2 GENE.c9831_g1_i2~~c9831_g1_i2.p2  ORF type:complete len:142 (+),score=31.64 c9831_g1_i2:254-679(+)
MQAILRYAGKLAGLYPEDPLAALRVDSVLDTIEDANNLLGPTMRLPAEEKLAARKRLAEEVLPKFFAFLESHINRSANGFVAGDALTIADLRLFGLTSWFSKGVLDGIPADYVSTNYPACEAHRQHIAAHPKIVEWYSEHK